MANVIRIGGGGAGGSAITLPPMVTNLKAVGSNATITVTFTNPVSDALAGVLVVYNSDHMPEKPSDGRKFDAGLTQQAVITGLTNGTQYYIRVFPYNEKKQYQTLIDGATTSATPNIGPAQVTNFQVTGSGSSPVLSWVNPTDDPLYHETVVIQKVGSAPTSLTDGTEIYRGTGTTVTATDLVRLEAYYFAVFTIDEAGSYRTPVVSEMYSYDFPDPPTSYTMIEDRTVSGTFIAPEDGWYQLDAVSKSGNGGQAMVSAGVSYSGSSGGSGAIARKTGIALYKGETITYTISGNVNISEPELGIDISVTAGADNGGGGGIASGGDTNINGLAGQHGTYANGRPIAGPNGPSTPNSFGLTVKGGTGGGTYSFEGNLYPTYPAECYGTAAFIRFYRGDTNIPSPSTASVMSLTPRNASIEASWTNSGDPESVGTILVSNSDHVPAHPTDGTSVDVAEATSYTVTDLPNNKPSYISLFAYNADKTKYSAARSDVEIPREVTWADTVEEAQQEAKEATDKAAVAEEQAKQANETLQAKTEELAQTSAELTEKQVMVDSATATFNALIASDIQNDTKVISDNMILDNADMLSKPWGARTPNEVGDIVWYMIGDVKQYYKVVQPTENVDPNHTPNIVPAVFVAINKTNAGTIDDPIPAVRGMEYEYGKYYLDNEDGKIYICKRGEETGTIVLQYLPHELIGHYFEEVIE